MAETTAPSAIPAPATSVTPAAVSTASVPPAAATAATETPGQAAPSPAPVTPTPEAAPVEKAPAAPEPATSLLSEAGKPAVKEAPPAEAKPATPEGEVKAAEEAPITYEPWKAPEGITLSEADTKPFNELLAGLKAPQEVGQQLIDMHAAELKKFRDHLATEQQNAWKATREEWVKQVRADPEVGGSRLNTALEAAGALIEQYGGNTPKQRQELREVLGFTGAGDHPAMLRLFNNLGKALALEGKPVPAFAPVPVRLTRAERRYSKSLPNGAQTL